MEYSVSAGLIHIKAHGRHSPQNALVPPIIPVQTADRAQNQ